MTTKRLLPRTFVAPALVIALVAGFAHAAGAASKTVTPQRYVRAACGALVTWIGATSPIDEQITTTIDALKEKKSSAAKSKTKVVTLYTKATKASDKLVSTTKAIGVPKLDGGSRLASDHVRTLTEIRGVYDKARKAATKLKATNGTTLYVNLEALNSRTIDEFDTIGMPLETLRSDSTLKPIIDADNRCADVIDAYSSNVEPLDFNQGDCVTLEDYSVVDCAKPHDIEVYVVGSFQDAASVPYPGNSAVNQIADQLCESGFESYVGIPLGQSKYTYYALYPSAETWAAGDRQIVCGVVNQDDSKLTGSVKGSRT
ncbi:MAG TPA: septum formation family protein [Acidimicrobiia bacterium]|nr:septum formation family protein [Acidimicrobiia bacterium]